MRRTTLLLIAVLLGAGLTAGTVTLASSGEESSGTTERSTQRTADRGHHRAGHGRGLHRTFKRMVLKSLAGRLGVEPRALRVAVREVAREQWAARLAQAGLSKDEIAALKACHRRGHRGHARARARAARDARRGACDRAAARAAREKLRSAPDPDLAALKGEVAAALATKLSVAEEKLLEAVRAELVQRLDQGVAIGLLTPQLRDQALGCFDTPATCDLRALHRGARPHGGRHHRRG